jgi:hypothetical protein
MNKQKDLREEDKGKTNIQDFLYLENKKRPTQKQNMQIK